MGTSIQEFRSQRYRYQYAGGEVQCMDPEYSYEFMITYMCSFFNKLKTNPRYLNHKVNRNVMTS